MKEPRPVDDPPLFFEEGSFVFYGRNAPFEHNHRTCPTHKADGKGHKKAHRSEKRTLANVWETKVPYSRRGPRPVE